MPEQGENLAILHWDPKIGFELDVDFADDAVAIRMVRVPVPADGTDRLGEDEPVYLFSIDTLFKTQVDVEDAPGQLNDVGVRLERGKLVLTAMLEDAETGETQDIEIRLPVQIENGAPESGGPVPEEPDEDELDWEDEETLEQMISKAPEVARRTEREKPDEAGAGKEEAGLLALLRDILQARPEVEATPVAPEERVSEPRERDEPLEGEAETNEPVQVGVPEEEDAMGELLSAVFEKKAAVHTEADGLMSAEEEAKSLLDLLVNQDSLELVEGFTSADLAPGLVPLLARPGSPERRAAAISAWLLDQPAVEELYIDDEELAQIIEQW